VSDCTPPTVEDLEREDDEDDYDLRPETARPKWADLYGIDPDFTGGKPVDVWLDEQRGEA